MEVKACRIGTEVVIGYSPENKARQIRIDLAKWLSVWPKAKPVLLVVRPDENEAYPAKTEMDGQTMVWTVRSYDTEIPGTGEAWIVFRGEDDEMLGVTPHTSVLIKRGPPNIDGETPPDGAIPWVSDVMDAAQRAEDAAERAEEIVEGLAGGGEIDSDRFLPSVKEEDNGKVLTVVGGKWAAAEPPESGGVELLTAITYSELKTLRDGRTLIPGCFYRITDYETVTTQEGTQSAGHQFDVIVRAMDEKTFDEEAKAIQHDGDEYFAGSALGGWRLWYTLDNDTTRFAWADEASGKGVIYRMIDEWDNDLPYDFKNIQMLDANNGDDANYYFTFDNNGADHSLNGSKCYSNVIKKYIDDTHRVNRIIFKNTGNTEISTNFFDYECYNNTLGSATDHMRFGRECYGNVFAGMNHLCTFDTKFRNNTVGGETQSIQVGQGATGNSFAGNIYYSSFGNYFRNNVLCRYLYYSTFGHYVQNIILGESKDAIGKNMRFLTFENNVQYVNLYKADANTGTYMENVKLCSGLVGTSSARKMIKVSELAQKYAITYANDSRGNLVKYCDADKADVDKDEIAQYVIDKLPIYDGEVIVV